jgi:hypothetical protein
MALHLIENSKIKTRLLRKPAMVLQEKVPHKLVRDRCTVLRQPSPKYKQTWKGEIHQYVIITYLVHRLVPSHRPDGRTGLLSIVWMVLQDIEQASKHISRAWVACGGCVAIHYH